MGAFHAVEQLIRIKVSCVVYVIYWSLADMNILTTEILDFK